MTMVMDLTSRPRAATSVATRILDWPDLKAPRAMSRSRWSLSPWMASHFTPMRSRLRWSWSHMRLVFVKMITWPSALRRQFTSWLSFSRTLLQTMTSCSMSALAWSSSALPILTSTGSRKKSWAILRTSFGQVAVNIIVCLRVGMWPMTFRICGSKPMSSIRSASSRTRKRTSPRLIIRPSRKSFRRPGVPVSRWGLRLRSPSWGPLGAPP
mmetsp:Transcript_105581/g.315368  ORF Transcript_105581/g.315368 Transcript_105581/m.315368 type:complete len:211 (+) Transcript_105581:372-1004(+)